MRRALRNDVPQLVALMTEFYSDSVFIQPAFRGRGLGQAALQEVRAYCASHGIRGIYVSTGRDNASALAVYRRAGFVDADHVLLTLGLADPTHAP